MDPKELKKYFSEKLGVQLTDEQLVNVMAQIKEMPPQHRDGKAVINIIKEAKLESLKEAIEDIDPIKIKQDLNRLDEGLKTAVDTGPIDDILEQIKNA
jgi:hypothetical protein